MTKAGEAAAIQELTDPFYKVTLCLAKNIFNTALYFNWRKIKNAGLFLGCVTNRTDERKKSFPFHKILGITNICFYFTLDTPEGL